MTRLITRILDWLKPAPPFRRERFFLFQEHYVLKYVDYPFLGTEGRTLTLLNPGTHWFHRDNPEIPFMLRLAAIWMRNSTFLEISRWSDTDHPLGRLAEMKDWHTEICGQPVPVPLQEISASEAAYLLLKQ